MPASDFMTYMPIGLQMGLLTKQYFGALSKSLEHLGLDRHFFPLVVIDKTKEKCTQQYLSSILGIDKVCMVRVIDHLVDKGLITREVNAKDRREHLIKLTPKGKKIMPDIYNGINDMNTFALKGVKTEDQEAFHIAMEKMGENLEKLPVNKVDIQIIKNK